MLQWPGCFVQFFGCPWSEGWPHHGRTFSIYLCPLSFWLTLPQRVLSTSWCCPSRQCVVFLACVHLALFLASCISVWNIGTVHILMLIMMIMIMILVMLTYSVGTSDHDVGRAWPVSSCSQLPLMLLLLRMMMMMMMMMLLELWRRRPWRRSRYG